MIFVYQIRRALHGRRHEHCTCLWTGGSGRFPERFALDRKSHSLVLPLTPSSVIAFVHLFRSVPVSGFLSVASREIEIVRGEREEVETLPLDPRLFPLFINEPQARTWIADATLRNDFTCAVLGGPVPRRALGHRVLHHFETVRHPSLGAEGVLFLLPGAFLEGLGADAT
jgi:hypothetical protein